jgi:hypothetical protein
MPNDAGLSVSLPELGQQALRRKFSDPEAHREHMQEIARRSAEKRRGGKVLSADAMTLLLDPVMRSALRQLIGVLDDIAGNGGAS